MRCPSETHPGYLPPRIIENQVRILSRGITLSGLINKEDILDGSKPESHIGNQYCPHHQVFVRIPKPKTRGRWNSVQNEKANKWDSSPISSFSFCFVLSVSINFSSLQSVPDFCVTVFQWKREQSGMQPREEELDSREKNTFLAVLEEQAFPGMKKII